MKTGKNSRLFLVLVPHRDIRVALRKYNYDLLKTTGFCHFPHVAPLAALSRPFTKDELKQCAHAIREITMERKIIVGEMTAVPFPANDEKTVLFGPRLDPVIEQDLLIKIKSTEKKITDFFSTQVIGCCVTNENTICAPPQLSFRAAAVANMYWKPVNIKGTFGFEWKIGELIWLPKNLTK